VTGFLQRLVLEEARVIFVLIAISVAVLTFISGIFGLYLHKRLPQEHTRGDSREAIVAVIGLATLLLALVLGTLVVHTSELRATVQSDLNKLASRALLVDQALAQYGPEAKPARDRMKQALTQAYDLFWRGGDVDPRQLRVDVALTRWQEMTDPIRSLSPTTAAQKDALSVANLKLAEMEEMRLLMSLELASPIAWSIVIIVVAWSMCLFCGFGVLSGTNSTTIAVLGLGAIFVASAIYLIQDLSRPLSGSFRISPAALEQTIEAIDK
jgi:ABC-type multidrug transport system fused ATPase/permease subunit